ncbi:hypothetical protein Tsubulata_002654 [Turnera subulata]|uniref:Uncharacterized protein n=1 Tax=Turnera subulata TaxID=218843 RepID=A0A9Q0G7K8_9ROSI|nr:hypothetical protein Tsubulata_002654 [Turnera subulata]
MSCCSLLLRIPPKFAAFNIQPIKHIPSSSGSFDAGRRRTCFSCKSQLTDLAPATTAVYGALLLGGGLFAFNKSGSKGSLSGGLTGAALMATAYALMQAQETKAIGDALGFGSALLFSCVFGIRFAATRKLVLAGPLLVLSIAALLVCIFAYVQDSM